MYVDTQIKVVKVVLIEGDLGAVRTNHYKSDNFEKKTK